MILSHTLINRDTNRYRVTRRYNYFVHWNYLYTYLIVSLRKFHLWNVTRPSRFVPRVSCFLPMFLLSFIIFFSCSLFTLFPHPSEWLLIIVAAAARHRQDGSLPLQIESAVRSDSRRMCNRWNYMSRKLPIVDLSPALPSVQPLFFFSIRFVCLVEGCLLIDFQEKDFSLALEFSATATGELCRRIAVITIFVVITYICIHILFYRNPIDKNSICTTFNQLTAFDEYVKIYNFSIKVKKCYSCQLYISSFKKIKKINSKKLIN